MKTLIYLSVWSEYVFIYEAGMFHVLYLFEHRQVGFESNKNNDRKLLCKSQNYTTSKVLEA